MSMTPGDANRGSEERRLQGVLSKQDYLRAAHRKMRPTITFVATVTLVGIVVWSVKGAQLLSILVSLVVACAAIALLEASARRRWYTIDLFREPFEVSWDDGGISYSNSSRTTTYGPGSFTNADEANGLVTLWVHDAAVVIIPETCFVDSTQKQDLIGVARTLMTNG